MEGILEPSPNELELVAREFITLRVERGDATPSKGGR